MPMFLAVPSRFGIALSLEAVPILPLDADDISLVFSDSGRLDGGRELSISSWSVKFQCFGLFFTCALTWKQIGCPGDE
jgi:hypothetical protein